MLADPAIIADKPWFKWMYSEETLQVLTQAEMANGFTFAGFLTGLVMGFAVGVILTVLHYGSRY